MKHDRTNFIAKSLTNPLTILFKETFNITRVSEKKLTSFSQKAYLNLIQAVRDSGNNTEALTSLFTKYVLKLQLFLDYRKPSFLRFWRYRTD